MTSPIYQLEALSFHYTPSHEVLPRLDLEIREGEFLGVIGPNGAGKSTLLHLLSGLLRANSGTISFRDKPMRAWSRLELAREVAVVPQREEQCFSFTVEEIVLMGRYARQRGLAAFDDDEDRDVARAAIHSVGLGGFEQRLATHLSAGERQRMLIARALAQQTKVILLDEPTTSLDLHHQKNILSLLETLNGEKGITVVAVSHDLNLAAMYCRELVLLSAGNVVARGTTELVMQESLLSDVYQVPLKLQSTTGGHPFICLTK